MQKITFCGNFFNRITYLLDNLSENNKNLLLQCCQFEAFVHVYGVYKLYS